MVEEGGFLEQLGVNPLNHIAYSCIIWHGVDSPITDHIECDHNERDIEEDVEQGHQDNRLSCCNLVLPGHALPSRSLAELVKKYQREDKGGAYGDEAHDGYSVNNNQEDAGSLAAVIRHSEVGVGESGKATKEVLGVVCGVD